MKPGNQLVTNIDAVIPKHPDCGIIVTGDFNQLNDTFLKTHYRFVQVVNVGTRRNAVLDRIWTNMDKLYMSPVTISELGTLDLNMVLLKPSISLHRRSQDFVCLGEATRPTPPSHASVVHTFEVVVGSWGSVSVPAVSRVIGGAPERNKNSKKYRGNDFGGGFL